MRPNRVHNYGNRASQQGMARAIFVFLSVVVFAASATALDGSKTRVVLTSPDSLDDVAQEMRLEMGKSTFLQTDYKIERLSVGDADFQKKCLGKMDEVAKEGRTVLFVSHNMAAVRKLCETGILLDSGAMLFNGPVFECVSKYLEGGTGHSGSIM